MRIAATRDLRPLNLINRREELPFGPSRGLSCNELIVLKEYIEENQSKGFIRASSSLASSPVLFIKNGNGSFILWVHYRGINEMTIKNRYHLPLIQETIMMLSKAKWFTKLDLHRAYNLVRMGEGEDCQDSLWTFRVSGFAFWSYQRSCLVPTLHKHCVTALAGRILQCPRGRHFDLLQHCRRTPQHVQRVLESLNKAGLYLKHDK